MALVRSENVEGAAWIAWDDAVAWQRGMTRRCRHLEKDQNSRKVDDFLQTD